MKQKRETEEIIGMVFLALSILMLCISVYLCFSSDIWYDELFTMGLGNRPLGSMISITARDVHPPLYYMIVGLILHVLPASFSVQVAAAKVLSVLPFFLCLLYAGTKIRKNFGMLTAGLFCFLLVSMPQMAAYTVEIRMYGYALFFVTAAMLHAYELTKVPLPESQLPFGQGKKLDWAALTLYSLAACYTHYFACVAACMVYLYLLFSLLIKRRMKQAVKPFLISGLICAAGYLPWLLLVVTSQVGRVKENYWIAPVSLRTLGGCVKFIFMPAFGSRMLNVILTIALFLIFLCLLYFSFIRKKQNNISFVLGCFCVLSGLVLFGMLASLVLRPVFVYRYMLPALGVFWLGFALLVTALKEKKKLFIPLLLLLAIVGLRNYRAFYGDEMWKRVQMKETQNAFADVKDEDILIFNFDQVQAVVSAYLPNETYLWYGEPEELIREMFPSNHALTEEEFTDEAGIRRLHELLESGRTVWYFGSGNAREEILEKWRKEGIFSEEKNSVLLERYWFNIYALTGE